MAASLAFDIKMATSASPVAQIVEKPVRGSRVSRTAVTVVLENWIPPNFMSLMSAG